MYGLILLLQLWVVKLSANGSHRVARNAFGRFIDSIKYSHALWWLHPTAIFQRKFIENYVACEMANDLNFLWKVIFFFSFLFRRISLVFLFLRRFSRSSIFRFLIDFLFAAKRKVDDGKKKQNNERMTEIWAYCKEFEFEEFRENLSKFGQIRENLGKFGQIRENSSKFGQKPEPKSSG